MSVTEVIHCHVKYVGSLCSSSCKTHHRTRKWRHTRRTPGRADTYRWPSSSQTVWTHRGHPVGERERRRAMRTRSIKSFTWNNQRGERTSGEGCWPIPRRCDVAGDWLRVRCRELDVQCSAVMRPAISPHQGWRHDIQPFAMMLDHPEPWSYVSRQSTQ